MKRKRLLLFVGIVSVIILIAVFISRDHIILNSKLYTVDTISCHEEFSVCIDPADYNGTDGEIVIDQCVAEKYDTMIMLKKISVEPDDSVHLYIDLDHTWNIFHGENMVLYTVDGEGKSRGFRYDPLDFSITNTSGREVPYSQYGMSNDTIIISLDKDVFFGQNGSIILDFVLNKCIAYRLGA